MKNRSLLIISIFTLLLFVTSCANLSKNSVKEGEFIVRNGTSGKNTWIENLVFKRVSWYHELTLEFDLMMANVPPQSGFNFWFSPDELAAAGKCGDFRIILAYSSDTKILPYSTLNTQLDLAGFKKLDMSAFKLNFLQHPDSEMNSLRLYQVYGACRSEKELKPLIFNFPGFSEKTVN
ncbi:MAG: hypothetical protein K2Q18_09485 [Bdellovibrionales bacterium]|nr:hypothetical protein [Bdellovibrionales bacterium]